MLGVWTGSGLWHGAAWTFLIWGWLNMAIMFCSQVMEPCYTLLRNTLHISQKNSVWHVFRVIRTFFIVCFLFFITRADSLTSAAAMLRWMVADIHTRHSLRFFDFFPNLEPGLVVILLAAVLLLFCKDMLSELGKWDTVKERTPFVIRDLVYVLLILSIILFAGTGENIARNFIYANF